MDELAGLVHHFSATSPEILASRPGAAPDKLSFGDSAARWCATGQRSRAPRRKSSTVNDLACRAEARWRGNVPAFALHVSARRPAPAALRMKAGAVAGNGLPKSYKIDSPNYFVRFANRNAPGHAPWREALLLSNHNRVKL
jgi:hypothetical protein